LPPVLLAALASLNVLQNGFGWDDRDIILQLRLPDPWWSLFLTAGGGPSRDPSSYFRPLISFSYLLDFKVWGDRPFGFHLSVWIAHLINTALVFFLAKRLTEQDEKESVPARKTASLDDKTSLGRALPLLAATLFAVHPIHAEAVAWIAGRNDVFCTTFILASMLLYTHAHATTAPGRSMFGGFKSGLLFSAAMLAFFLGLMTKEIAIGLVLLFPLHDYFSTWSPAASSGPARASQSAASFGTAADWRRAALRVVIPLGILGFYFYQRSRGIQYPIGNASDVVVFSAPTFWKMVGAFGLYMDRLVFPYPHDPFIAAIPAGSLFRFLSVAEALLLAAGIILSIRSRNILMFVGLVWTFVTLAPAVWVAALHVTPAPAAERYLYAPSAGFVMAVAGLIFQGWSRFPAKPAGSGRTRWALAGGIVLALILLWGRESWERNTVWRTPSTFWEAAVAASPEAGFPIRQLATQYYQSGQYEKAEPLYQRTIAIFEKTLAPDHPDLAQALSGLGALYYSERRYAEAGPMFERSLAIREKTLGPDHPETAKSLNNLAALYYSQGKYDQAESYYRRVLGIWEKGLGPAHPDVAMILDNLAVLDYARGRYKEAEPLFQRSLAIREKVLGQNHPDLAIGLDHLAGLYFAEGRYDAAEPLFQRSLAIRQNAMGPGHPLVATSLSNYALLLRKTHREAEAEAMEKRAAAIRAQRTTR